MRKKSKKAIVPGNSTEDDDLNSMKMVVTPDGPPVETTGSTHDTKVRKRTRTGHVKIGDLTSRNEMLELVLNRHVQVLMDNVFVY